MAVWSFEDKIPQIGKNTYIAESALVIGDVNIGENCYIGPGTCIRGDYGTIIIGNKCAIQENAVIHTRMDEETILGSNITVGHGAILHSCTLDDNSVIGMGAIVSDFAHVGKWAVIGEKGLVRRGQQVNDYEIAVGIPVRIIGKITDKPKIRQELSEFKVQYQDLVQKYLNPNTMKRVD